MSFRWNINNSGKKRSPNGYSRPLPPPDPMPRCLDADMFQGCNLWYYCVFVRARVCVPLHLSLCCASHFLSVFCLVDFVDELSCWTHVFTSRVLSDRTTSLFFQAYGFISIFVIIWPCLILRFLWVQFLLPLNVVLVYFFTFKHQYLLDHQSERRSDYFRHAS